MNAINEFLRKISRDPQAKELLKGLKDPADAAEAAAQYAAVAEKLGLSVQKEDLQKFIEIKQQVHKEKAAEAEKAVKEAVPEQDLDSVAGGGAGIDESDYCTAIVTSGETIESRCSDSYMEGEWCWFTDSCSYVINGYDDGSNDEVDPKTQELCTDAWANVHTPWPSCFDLDL